MALFRRQGTISIAQLKNNHRCVGPEVRRAGGGGGHGSDLELVVHNSSLNIFQYFYPI